MENSIYAIESKSVAMKILRENIIWHWFHFIEETKRYETKEMKKKRKKKKKKEKIYIYRVCVCTFFHIVCTTATRVTVFLKQWSPMCCAVAYKRKHIVTHTHANAWQVVRSSMIARVQEILAVTHENAQFKYHWLFLHRFKNFSHSDLRYIRDQQAVKLLYSIQFCFSFFFFRFALYTALTLCANRFFFCCCTHGHWA